ncbi:putative protein (DUF1320 domain) [Campylobacter pinnipediorum subsp. caledonicus]|uniref:Uncharacterized protein n=1 Tax=Campylobacter pinnipediorum subsp. caledonicus TaxID=1874362 RepID=A0A1S6U8X2_9BACT|nr:phage protein Gp36 family protein [Campylobacter pinnipediorum]AQW85475.1 putative protein (DUF1320 domain) [Campylobacter pinnipediorum subsp. caledonicus]AQW87887.1 putative protein (DUF1320 domain) [Campylobacter pinnipediorum subsp. caledonicus]
MINNDDLLKELSLKELIELSDFEGAEDINQDIIDDSINDALSYISSFIKIPQEPTPLLKDICCDLTIIELKKRNNFPKEALKEQLDKCDSLLLKMAAKKIPTTIQENDEPKAVLRAFKHSNEKMDLENLNS